MYSAQVAHGTPPRIHVSMMASDDLCERILQAVTAARGELQKSQADLPPLAAYVASEYTKATSAVERQKAFREGQSYAAQTLASVAYQVNSVAGHVLALLDAEAAQLDHLTAQVKAPQRVSWPSTLHLFRPPSLEDAPSSATGRAPPLIGAFPAPRTGMPKIAHSPSFLPEYVVLPATLSAQPHSGNIYYGSHTDLPLPLSSPASRGNAATSDARGAGGPCLHCRSDHPARQQAWP